MLALLRNFVISKPLLRNTAIATIKTYNNAVGVLLYGNRYANSSVKNIDNYNKSRILGARPKVCYAPFSNLYFGTTGAVTACCFNREYVLGNYPQNSIKEIWEGEKANQLREHINNADLSLGCGKCAETIESKNYAAVNAATYDYFTSSTAHYPTRIDFELSNTCNLECVMCNGYCSSTIRKNVEKLPPLPNYYDDAFVAQLEEYLPHVQYAKFLGGEPFLIEIYYKIWERMAVLSPNCIMYLQTNGTVLNEKVKNALANGRFNIGVSIDSLQKEKAEAIRVNAKLDRVLENVGYFAQYCKEKGTEFSICFSPMRNTVDELEDFILFSNKVGANAYFNIVFEPHNVAIWNLPAAELEALITKFRPVRVPATTALERKNAQMFYSFVEQLKQWYASALERQSVANTVELNVLIEQATVKIAGYIIANKLRCIHGLIDKLKRYYTSLSEHDRAMFGAMPVERLYNQVLVFGNNFALVA